MRPIRLIILHHSTTPDGATLSWPAIRRYHMEVRGWRSIAYQYGVERAGDVYETLVGCPLRQRGIHAPPRNHDSIGICLIGNFEIVPPPDLQLVATATLIKDLLTVFNLDVEAVVGHGDVTPGRSCPGEKFPLARCKEMVRDIA